MYLNTSRYFPHSHVWHPHRQINEQLQHGQMQITCNVRYNLDDDHNDDNVDDVHLRMIYNKTVGYKNYFLYVKQKHTDHPFKAKRYHLEVRLNDNSNHCRLFVVYIPIISLFFIFFQFIVTGFDAFKEHVDGCLGGIKPHVYIGITNMLRNL
jgi:hypothetical protein